MRAEKTRCYGLFPTHEKGPRVQLTFNVFPRERDALFLLQAKGCVEQAVAIVFFCVHKTSIRFYFYIFHREIYLYTHELDFVLCQRKQALTDRRPTRRAVKPCPFERSELRA